MQDIRNNPTSAPHADALVGFEGALKSFQTYFGDPIEQIERTLQAHPNFILGHLLRAIAYYLSSERRYREPAVVSLGAARELLADAVEREAMLYDAVEHLVEGSWANASAAFDVVLRHYPTDILALQTGHLLDFFRGDALNLRNRPGRVVGQWDEALPGYSHALGMYAFGLEEANHYDLAERTGRRALDLDPVDPWAVHAVVHVMEMTGRSGEGVEFLEQREQDWAPDNAFSYHNWWHLGLFYIEQGDDAKVRQLLDEHIFLDADDALVLVDVTAMLWRLKLMGVALGDRCERLAAIWARKIRDEAGYYGFNDFHAALSFAAAGRAELLDELEAKLTQTGEPNHLTDAPYNVPMIAEVALPLVRAVQAYARGDFAGASGLLAQVRDRAHLFGGSHAQRDLVNVTLLSAAGKAGDGDLVRHLMNERIMLKPRSVLGERVVAAA